MQPLDFIIAALATWRLSSLLVNERGPFDVFVHVREHAGIQHDEEGKAILWPDTFFGELLSCIWCLSIYIGVGVTLLIALSSWSVWIMLPLALSAAAILIDKVNNG